MSEMKSEIPKGAISAKGNKIKARLAQIEKLDDEEKPGSFNIAVILGGSWEPRKEGERLELSVNSKLRTLAGGVLASEGKVSEIIFTGGKTAGVENPSEAQAMADFLKLNFPNLKVPVELDSESFDTIENAKFVKKIVDKVDLAKVLVVTNDFHLARTLAIFDHVGMSVDAISAESILLKTYHWHQTEKSGKVNHYPYKRFIERHLKSGEMKKKRIVEVGLRAITKIDPEGKLLTALAKKLRRGDETKKD